MKTKTNRPKSISLKPLHLICALLALVVSSLSVNAAEATVHSYSAHGVVERIAPSHRQVTIHNQAIPGYMMAMTMDFNVRNPKALNGISPGDKIDFTLMVNATNSWVENIKRTGHTSTLTGAAVHTKSPEKHGRFTRLKPGDLFPDGEMISEHGKRVPLSQFRGKAVALTFFFTRCPLPNYCPLMNRNFAATRKLLQAETNAPTNWELLSISFDTGFDKPQTLVDFARLYRGESSSHWLFATATKNALRTWAPSVGLIVMRQGSTISHNLRTVVLDPQGRIFRQFNGNTWTAKELADALCKAAEKK